MSNYLNNLTCHMTGEVDSSTKMLCTCCVMNRFLLMTDTAGKEKVAANLQGLAHGNLYLFLARSVAANAMCVMVD